jgi:M6 family metalloprotease-like protein
MRSNWALFSTVLGLADLLALRCNAAGPPPDLADYRTVGTAATATVQPLKKSATGATGFLGIEVGANPKGRLVVSAVAEVSPAAQAGVRADDVLLKLDGAEPGSAAEVRDRLQQHVPGDTVAIVIERNGSRRELTATLGAVSRPLKISEQRAVLGVQVTPLEDAEGVRVTRVTSGLPAEKAGIRTNDVFVKLDGMTLSAGANLGDLLASREPGEQVTVAYRRGEDEKEFTARLAAEEAPDTVATFSRRSIWKKNTYRLAVIGVGFDDVRPNPVVTPDVWDEFFFSTDSYRGVTNVTGQPVFGSVNDYYQEVSCGKFSVTGKFFDWVTLAKKRADYSQGTANTRTREAFFREVLDKVFTLYGASALKDFDGLAVIYAGERFPTANRGTLFWPHRGNATYKNRRYPYIICPEGGPRMANTSVFCHEFGHILGLPDLYARPENPGSEGLGTWCAMSNQAGNGRPQHFSAWCKEQLGWLQPAVIDPAVRQKLVLAPVEGSSNECFKVLVRADGSEYLLLENRRKQGFDRSLSGEGLLIWRVTGNRLTLEESHGVEGPSGPRVFLSAVPYPSGANDAFTPYTTPSSRSQLGGGTPVYLTNIRRLADGRVSFQVGYEFE